MPPSAALRRCAALALTCSCHGASAQWTAFNALQSSLGVNLPGTAPGANHPFGGSLPYLADPSAPPSGGLGAPRPAGADGQAVLQAAPRQPPAPHAAGAADLEQLQAEALRDPRLDSLCPGRSRSSTDVGEECWQRIWVLCGCRAENTPRYEQWHRLQSLEVLVADVVQWAHLPDERHRQGCHGTSGLPGGDVPPPVRAAPEQLPAQLRGGGDSRRLASRPLPVQTREDLAELFQTAGARPIILEFWSEACGFCHIMLPVFELLAGKYRGRAYFRTVDVGSVPGVADAFQVLGLPAFKAVLMGQLVGESDGADTAALERLVEGSIRRADLHDVRLSEQDLEDFLSRRDPEAVASSRLGAGALLRASADVPALLESLEAQYGARPRTTGGFIPGAAPDDLGAEAAAEDGLRWRRQPPEVEELEDREIAAEIRRLQQELRRRQLAGAEAASSRCAEARRAAGRGRVEQLVVLGGGPAGLAAALYAARAGLCPLVVAPPVGGQLMAKGVDVENYPGLTRAHGSSIIQDMRAQAAIFSAQFQDGSVASVDLQARPLALHLNDTSGEGAAVLRTEALIVATGADSRWLGARGEQELRGAGVSTCAVCDGYLYRGRRCVVVGGGDTAMEEALFLARICASVAVVHRRGEFRASQTLQARVLDHPSVMVHWHSQVDEFLGEQQREAEGGVSPRLVGLLLSDTQTGGITRMPADGCFVAIGQDPNTRYLQGQVRMDAGTGYLETIGRSTHTSVPGVFAAGDVADPAYRQAVTAAGSGAAAALDAERWLSLQSRGGPSSARA